MNSFLPTEIPQNSMAVQQRLPISELQFDKFPHTFNVFMSEDKIQNPSDFLFWFSFQATLWIKEVEMVDSVDELESSR